MKISELLNEFEFPDIGGKIYDLTHPPASNPTVSNTPTTTNKIAPATGQSGTPAKPAPTIPQVQAKPEPTPFDPSSAKPTLISIAKKMGITAINDLSLLLGNVQVETAGWTAATENFMYTDPTRIYNVFTSKFANPNEAIPYVKNPVALANRAYANKLNNGDESSGDGWRYRGRGFLHITGKENYSKCGAGVHPENPNIYIDHPELLSSNPVESAKASVWYYKNVVGKGKTSKQAAKSITGSNNMKQQERGKAAKIARQELLPKKKNTR